MVYNVPGRTSVNLLPATVERLAAVENIVAVKEASGNLDQTTEIIRRVPPDFRVYSGDDSLTLPIMSAGGYGIVSVASHIAGRQNQTMMECYVAGEVVEAARWHRWLFPVVKALFAVTSPIPVKAAVELLGLRAGLARPPLCPIGAPELAGLRAAMTEAGLLPRA